MKYQNEIRLKFAVIDVRNTFKTSRKSQILVRTRRISVGSSSYIGKVRDMYGTGNGGEREE